MPKQTSEVKSQPKAKREKKPKPLTPRDLMKLEIANEIGLLTKVQTVGWAGLSAQEAGIIGGIMSHRLRQAAPPEAGQPAAGQGGFQSEHQTAR